MFRFVFWIIISYLLTSIHNTISSHSTPQYGEHVSQLEANIAKVQQKMLEDAEHSDEVDDAPPPLPSEEKRGRGRPRKHKPPNATSVDGTSLYVTLFHPLNHRARIETC